MHARDIQNIPLIGEKEATPKIRTIKNQYLQLKL